MKLNPAKTLSGCWPCARRLPIRLIRSGLFAIGVFLAISNQAPAQTSEEAAAATQIDSLPHFNVSGFAVEGKFMLSTNVLTTMFSKYAGTNVSLLALVQAASDLEMAYLRNGYSNMNVIIAPHRIADGIVTLGVFPGAVPQIVVAGRRYAISDDEVGLAMHRPLKWKAPPAATNPPVKFTVSGYQVEGNTLLPQRILSLILTNVPGAFGTNVTLDKIEEVVADLQTAYSERGFKSVYVGVPSGQRLSATNAVVKVRVIEGRLNAIVVKGNHYFSSNNVMRAVPGLGTNMILNALTFQAELDRANANQDRQIYGILEPGPEEGTSDLILQVKDRLPLHAKLDLDDQSSPGTPDLRINSSAVYDNLWQLDQVLGIQYSFSPEQYKEGRPWNFYDLPSVANYSAFYRIPLGSPGAIDDEIAAQPGSFGYNEATRKFNLPPAGGQPDVTLFASRSTIDAGLTTSSRNLYTATATNQDGNITTNSTLDLNKFHEDITVNHDVGFRVDLPILTTVSGVHMGFSGGLDFKTYADTSVETNVYLLSSEIIDTTVSPLTNFVHSTDSATLPRTYDEVYYVPLALRYDVSWHDFMGSGTAGLGMSANLWDSAFEQQTAFGTYVDTNRVTGVVTTNSSLTTSAHGNPALQDVAGSKQSTGHWLAITPSFTHTFELVTNWVTTFRADGQWSSQPLISNEQFGAGGVNSVRGYQEGEVFGDSGWHLTVEQATPPHTVGMIAGRIPVILRGTVYMDYARVYLLDPQGRPPEVGLWGTGAGFVASIGSWWQARMLFSVPLLSAGTTTAYRPYVNFALTAQF